MTTQLAAGTMLILGATGSTGKYAVQHALDAGYTVHVLVRNPDKMLPSLKDRVHVIVGDLTDSSMVADVVTRTAPSSIIICSGHPPKDAVAPLNAIVIKAIVKALTDSGRLNDCFVVYLSGLFSDPSYDPLPWLGKVLRTILVPLSGFQASLSDNLEVTRYLTTGEGARSNLQFTIVRMAFPMEAPSKGTIIPVDHHPTGAVTFSDIGLFLVKIASGEHRQEAIGKAIKPSYAVNRQRK